MYLCVCVCVCVLIVLVKYVAIYGKTGNGAIGRKREENDIR